MGKGRVPRDGLIGVAGGVVAQRMRQAAGVFQLVVAPGQQFGDGVRGEEFRRDPLLGGFPGNRLGAVFAKLEGGRMGLVGPGAARAVKAVRLVGAQQQHGRFGDPHLVGHGLGGGLERTPAAGGGVVALDTGQVGGLLGWVLARRVV
ncbi:hypothetical protein D3C71_1173670 [compost metagenome]